MFMELQNRSRKLWLASMHTYKRYLKNIVIRYLDRKHYGAPSAGIGLLLQNECEFGKNIHTHVISYKSYNWIGNGPFFLNPTAKILYLDAV